MLAAYQTDNLLDASHFPFLHGSLSDRNPLMGEHEVVDQHEFGFAAVQRKLADDGVATEGWLKYTFAAPFTVLLRSEEPDGRVRQSFFQSIQPIDELHTRLFFMVRVPETDPDAGVSCLPRRRSVQTGRRVDHGSPSSSGHAARCTEDLHVRSDANAILYRRVMRHVLGPAGGTPRA